MTQAIMREGSPEMTEYTPGADVAAGDVVLLGNLTGITCGIAHADIANGALGALAMGGGVYDVVATSNYAAWSKVWWDNATDKITTTSTNNALFGFTTEAATAANQVIRALHFPRV